jgi:TolA-binding protein
MKGGLNRRLTMSTWKRMIRLVPLFSLAVAPVALADEPAVASAGNFQAPAEAPAAVDDASRTSIDSAEVQILELQEEIKAFRAQIADSDANGRQYLNQNLQPWR